MAGRPLYVAGPRQSSSLENTSLDGGIYLDALVQRHAKTGKPGVAARAHILFRGLIKNATVSPSRGLLARGIHPDGVAYWGEPSVDQYTGAIFGLWRYYHSTLAAPEEKAQVRNNQEKKPRLAQCRNYATYEGRVIPAWVQFQNAMALRILLDVMKEEPDLAVYREGASGGCALFHPCRCRTMIPIRGQSGSCRSGVRAGRDCPYGGTHLAFPQKARGKPGFLDSSDRTTTPSGFGAQRLGR